MGSSQGPVTAVIAAAGSGQRLGAGGPKAFVEVGGRPMVEWSIAALREAASIGEVVVAAPPGAAEPAHGVTADDPFVVAGGGTGLGRVETELVAIHDAARPLLSAELVEAVIAALLADPDADAAIAAAPVSDTIKRAGGAPEGDAALADGQSRTAFAPHGGVNA